MVDAKKKLEKRAFEKESIICQKEINEVITKFQKDSQKNHVVGIISKRFPQKVDVHLAQVITENVSGTEDNKIGESGN